MELLSPSGKKVCPPMGPLNAKLIIIGESPTGEEMAHKPSPLPLVGRVGKLLNNALRKAGYSRDDCYVTYCVPVKCAGDEFGNHDSRDVEWGKQRLNNELRQLTEAKVYLTLGAVATEWLLGGKPPVASYNVEDKPKEGFIGEWRGSVIPVRSSWGQRIHGGYEDYLWKAFMFGGNTNLNSDAVIVPTYHLETVRKQFTWHPWLLMDVAKAVECVEKRPELKSRKWFFDNLTEFKRLVYEDTPDVFSFDTELNPELFCIVTEDEVHVAEVIGPFKEPLMDLLSNPQCLKIAHNWLFDYAWARLKLDKSPTRPIFDTQGGAHVLHNALEKSLSPHIATRYTNWPYHKFLVNYDSRWYNGMDGVVCFDAYWEEVKEIFGRGLQEVASHDHKLFTPLLEMQAVGFRVSESERKVVEQELGEKLVKTVEELQELARPIIESKIGKFKKPQLFKKIKRCKCCGGKGIECWRCSGLGTKPSKKIDYLPLTTAAKLVEMRKSDLQALLKPCETCKKLGKVDRWLEFNPDSPKQVGEVIYRGLGIKPRRFKGEETIRQASLDAIRDKHPIIEKLIESSEIRAEWDTVNRLRTGLDGLLHCEFDPFGTGSGRVACKEGLLEKGTNAMNLPKEARRFVIPRDGWWFLYPDMSAIEARAMAVLSKDKNLFGAFMEPLNWPGNKYHGKRDCHMRTVQLMDQAAIKINREQSKVMIYGGFYGGGAKQLASEMNAKSLLKGLPERVTEEETEEMLDILINQVYGDVGRWRNRVVKEVLQTRKIRCPFTGREREWNGYILDRKTDGLKYEICKQVWSALPQHMAAWVLAEGLMEMYYDSGEWGKLLQPLIHVHDALLIETPVERLNEGKALASKILTREKWGMLFESEMKDGANWEACS